MINKNPIRKVFQVLKLLIKSFHKRNKQKDIKISYFNYVPNEEQIEESKFIYRSVNNNEYTNQSLIITGESISNDIRQQYRNFLVQAYNIMLNFDSNNINNSLPIEIRSQMPEFQLDYFISPGALFLHNNVEINNTDETFTYLETQSVNDANMKPDIIGYNSDSRNISIRDAANNDLLKELSSFIEWLYVN